MTIKYQLVRQFYELLPMKTRICVLLLTFILVSCHRNPLKINVSDVSVDLKIRHLDVDLLNQNKEQLKVVVPSLKLKYGDFFDIFTYRMIGIGGTNQPNFFTDLESFVSDTLINRLKSEVSGKVDTIKLRKDLTSAFKYYKHYFPDKKLPDIYTCISGFNQSVVIADNLIGVSLDKYLGGTSPFYEQLGFPSYKRKNMCPDRMVPEMMYAWALSEWPKSDKLNTLLSQMIQEGKMIYFLDAVLPETNDSLKIGYSQKQLAFCKANELKMWTYLAEHKELFSTERMNIKRFIDDGPYTAAFAEESPARTGVWIGWQIVRSYMKEHPEITLPELLANQDFQGILNESGYQP